MTTLIIVRHGHTALNDGDRFRGITDTPLSPRGLEEARLTGKAIASRWKLSSVYTSSVPRARQTAQAVASPFGLEPAVEPGILDMDWGQWTGRLFEDCRQTDPEAFRLCFDRASAFRAPGGQSFEELREISVAAVKAIARRHEDQAVAIVSHNINVRLLLLGFMEMSTDFLWRMNQGTCAINVIERRGELYYIGGVNDTCHTRQLAESSSAIVPGEVSVSERPVHAIAQDKARC